MPKSKVDGLYKLKRLVKSLSKLEGAEQEKAKKNILKKTLERGETYAKKGVEFKNIYGGSSHRGLRKSLRKEIKGDRGSLIASAPHAWAIEYGHNLVVKGYKFIPGRGMVKMPGEEHKAKIPARYWFRETKDVISREIDGIAKKEIDRMLRGAVKTNK